VGDCRVRLPPAASTTERQRGRTVGGLLLLGRRAEPGTRGCRDRCRWIERGDSPSLGSARRATSNDFEAVGGALCGLVADGVVRVRVISDRPLDAREWLGAEWVSWLFEREVAELASCDIGVMPLQRQRAHARALRLQGVAVPGRRPARRRLPRRRRSGSRARRRDGHPRATGEAWRAAVARLADDVALRARLGQAGRRRIEARHSIEANAATLASLLRTASGGRATAC
jgi:hypothetical protein